MNRWNHRRLQRQLDAYVDGEAAPSNAARIGAHLDDCPDCSADVRLTLALKRSLVRLSSRRRARSAVGIDG